MDFEKVRVFQGKGGQMLARKMKQKKQRRQTKKNIFKSKKQIPALL